MEKDIKISVLIPTYNVEKYIIKCLESIKNQTFENFEIVICDDCSKDKTYEIIENWKNNNSDININLIENEKNLGLVENRNKLLYIAKGEFVTFVDDDDYLEPDCLELLYSKVIEDNADYVISSFRKVDENGKILEEQQLPKNPSGFMNAIHHGTLYKASIIRENNLKTDGGTFDDAYFSILYACYSQKLNYVRKSTYNWIIRNSSTSFMNCDGLYRNFLDCLNKTYLLYEKVDDYKKAYIEYALIKIYFFRIFSFIKYNENIKLRDFLILYENTNKEMLKLFPNYKRNKFIKLSDRIPLRKKSRYVIFISCKLEKLHLMKLFLRFYYFIGRRKKFA